MSIRTIGAAPVLVLFDGVRRSDVIICSLPNAIEESQTSGRPPYVSISNISTL